MGEVHISKVISGYLGYFVVNSLSLKYRDFTGKKNTAWMEVAEIVRVYM